MQATIQEVTVETVQKGRNTYQVANVVYSSNGRNNQKKLFSFTNPAVFQAVSTAVQGATFEVEVTKNAQGYLDWVAVRPASMLPQRPAAGTPAYGGGKVTGSNYETPEERKLRQMYIIKQSSIGHAVELLSVGAKTPPSVDSVLETAQKFVDYVYGGEADVTKDILSPEEPDDIPY